MCAVFHFVLFCFSLFLYRRVERLPHHLLTFLMYYNIVCTHEPKLFAAQDVKKLTNMGCVGIQRKGRKQKYNIDVVSHCICQPICPCFTFLLLHKCVFSLCALSDTSARQSAPCFISPHCFLFLFDWHAILKRCLHHRGALDWTRLLDPILSHVWRKTASSLLLYL